jgi:hypothetical protein
VHTALRCFLNWEIASLYKHMDVRRRNEKEFRGIFNRQQVHEQIFSFNRRESHAGPGWHNLVTPNYSFS